jgi:hypothetical protein
VSNFFNFAFPFITEGWVLGLLLGLVLGLVLGWVLESRFPLYKGISRYLGLVLPQNKKISFCKTMKIFVLIHSAIKKILYLYTCISLIWVVSFTSKMTNYDIQHIKKNKK